MKNNSFIQAKGLKCDNPECNYKDMSIEIEDYEKYINYPCPKCGAPLLTLADYKSLKFLSTITELAGMLGVKPTGEVYLIETNGTGEMNIKKK
mgnify:FL=1